eukprot:Gb_38209 [translate_table: standard]
MAVQAQYPSNVLMAELLNRTRTAPLARDNMNNHVAPVSGVPISMNEVLQLQPNMNAASVAANLFHVYNSVAGMNFGQQQVLNGTVFSDPESELTCNISGSRKRPREEDILLTPQQRQQISQHLTLMNMTEFQQKNAAVPVPVSVPQSVGLVSTGLQLAYDDSRLNQPPTSTSARNPNGSTLFSILGDDLAAQIQQQQEEIDQLIKLHSEKVRIALEEKRQRHSRALVATLEKGILRRLKRKEAELEKVSRENAELEERVKQLSMESQIWQNMAKNNETMANTLRSNLEQVVAQTREQSREGRGDSEAEDAQSCCYDEDTADAHSRRLRENKELKEQRTCRVCRTNNSCILLLPCRHLCLCKECESRLQTCPLCKSMKNASVQVYMS